jgi:hypothetical protein
LYMSSVFCSVRVDSYGRLVHSREQPAESLANRRPEEWFQAIVDTGSDATGLRVVGHEWQEPVCFESSRSGAKFLSALAEAGMNPEDIVVQIAAPGGSENPAYLTRVCAEYRDRGFGLALDSVEASPNSIEAIRELRPDYLKPDPSFLKNLEKPISAASVRKLADVASQVGAIVIATGVEQIQTMENLWLLGVRCMQGGLFGSYCFPEGMPSSPPQLRSYAGRIGRTGCAPSIRRAECSSTAHANVLALGGQAHHNSLKTGLLPDHELIRIACRALQLH